MIDFEARDSARQISDTVHNLRKSLEKTRVLLDKAINAMTELHENIKPEEDEFSEPTVSILALRKFVDVHAELLFERNKLTDDD